MANAQAFNQAFRIHVKSIGPAASQELARAARSGETTILRDQTVRRGIIPGHTEAVDGQRGRPFESVKPDGQIVAVFDYRAEIVAACFEELRARSPVVSGDFRDSHFCQLDGQGLPPLTVPTAQQVKAVTMITVTNPLPYARKLEVGLTEGGAPFVKQVDPHIFESAAVAVKREFAGVARIKFSYVDLEGAYVPVAARAARRAVLGGARVAKRATQAIRYPAIFIDQW